jgi:hypothetical protein
MTFRNGYTIEAFVKLPEPFEGDRAWMGILSWEGRNGDAGRTTGWSPLEPTCSLNISPERFLQFVVGATSFDLGYGQGFCGWIGDLRISSKALRPARFLTPYA